MYYLRNELYYIYVPIVLYILHIFMLGVVLYVINSLKQFTIRVENPGEWVIFIVTKVWWQKLQEVSQANIDLRSSSFDSLIN